MLLPFFLLSLLSTALSLNLGTPVRTNGDKVPPKPIIDSLDHVLTTINDFYVPVYSFPEHGSYDVDSWNVQTRNYLDAVHAATEALEGFNRLGTDDALYVVDFVTNYVYHDLAAALEEVQTRRIAFREIGIESHVVLSIMEDWQFYTAQFHGVVVEAARSNPDDEIHQAYTDLFNAFNAVFEEYRKEFSVQSSWYTSFTNFLSAWRWTGGVHA